jgi:hypothetical protein
LIHEVLLRYRKTIDYTNSCGVIACLGNHNTTGVESAMKLYNHLIQKMDADSIALMYTADGDLGNMAHRRDSIRKFLSTFKNVSVLSQSSESTSIKITGDSCIQKGTYQQVVLISGKDTVRVKGEFKANRQWKLSEDWHIRRMDTKSLN